ncbi:MAG: sulfurase [Euryarchaeota archaeon]|jgi:cyclic pyranopterin phosphate synthase|nr:sulfurase [Euryarchaeota archaeon]|tara:strand:+ start:6 stop:473 length:468 start_codon:yes stop_codon:yes gene_type:complete
MSAVVHSINISTQGGVPKLPINKAQIKFEGVDGDFNKFRTEKKNSTGTRAVTLFSLEQIEKLKSEGHAIDVGTTGENITIEGVDWPSLEVGARMMIGEAMIELSEPTAPCSKIGKSFIDGAFSRIDHELELGWSRWSASVIEEGQVEIGSQVILL